ncbi:malonyl-ACP O-methyltransferase BioC [Planctomycetota bacterium]
MRERLFHNFNRSAPTYDMHSAIQTHVGMELITRVPENLAAQRVLEIGCGTGSFTRHLRQRFPYAAITAVDSSAAMLAQAKTKLGDTGIEFLLADAEQLPEIGIFDLVASNACLHWLTNLGQTLEQLVQRLVSDGTLLFSTFGPQTYEELGTVLSDYLGTDSPLVSRSFADLSQIGALLSERFTQVQLDREHLDRSFPSLLDLLRTIKYSGTQGVSQQVFTRLQLAQLQRRYQTRFGGIQATYQVFYGLAQVRSTPCVASS